MTELGNSLAARLTAGAGLHTIGFTTAASQPRRRLYVEFGRDHVDDGPVE